MVVISTVAFAGSDAAAPRAAAHRMARHNMGVHEAALEGELAQVRRATARFHDLDAALEAGYELGWVNGSGVRIITGCVFDPTAGGMGYHYFHPGLMTDLAVDPLKPEALVYAPGRTGSSSSQRGVRRPGPELQPSRSCPAADPDRARNGDAHPGPTARASLLPHACLGVEAQPGRDVRRLESRGHLPLEPRPSRSSQLPR